MRADEILLTQHENRDGTRRKRLEELIARVEKCRQAREAAIEIDESEPQGPTMPKTPGQQRVANLQQQADRAKQAVKAERQRQTVAKQNEKINQSRAIIARAKGAIAPQG